MLNYVYSMNIQIVVMLMLAFLLTWGICCQYFRTKMRIALNVIPFCISVIIILYTTLISRTPGTYDVVLTPFAALAAARQQPELYREMLMNVFLFFPLGLTLSNALPQPWRRWRRIAITVAFGCIFSAAIEFAQYRFSLGMAEMDDVICNTLGTFIGATSLLLSHVVEIIRKGPKT